jgi:hypothetical protein
LTVHPEYFFTQDETICSDDSVLWQGIYYKETGTYTETYGSVNGCDSIYELNLNVNSTYFFTEDQVICDTESYSWQGSDYTSTGTYYANYSSINSCDSIYELNLLVNPSFQSYEAATICDGDSLLWHGTFYKEEGNYYDNHSTVAGCDSTYELELTVAQHYYFYENETMCPGSYVIWHGDFRNSAGVYFDSLTTVHGCDSIFELHLDTTDSYHFVEHEAICEGDILTWQGSSYVSAGTYYKNYSTLAGCDSIYELVLQVNPSYYFDADYENICEGDSLLWHGKYYLDEDIYYDSLLTESGCDSIFRLTLSVHALPISYSILQADPTLFPGVSSLFHIEGGENSYSYFWSADAGVISMNANTTISVSWSSAGSYTLTVYAITSQSCFGDTISHEVEVSVEDAIFNISGNGAAIYPNPAIDKINVIYSEAFVLDIYDILGRKLLISDKNEIDISSLAPGTYFLKLSDRNNRPLLIEKLIKE